MLPCLPAKHRCMYVYAAAAAAKACMLVCVEADSNSKESKNVDARMHHAQCVSPVKCACCACVCVRVCVFECMQTALRKQHHTTGKESPRFVCEQIAKSNLVFILFLVWTKKTKEKNK